MTTTTTPATTQTPKKRRYKRNYVLLDRYKIKQLLKAYCVDGANSTEKEICKTLAITKECYWDRFDKNKWNNEKVYALCYVLTVTTGVTITPMMIIKDN